MLPEPRNRKENDFLNSLTTERFYLGATDNATEGHWVWRSDGSSVQWEHWASAEPDGGSGQNCAVMLGNADKNNMDRWVSVWCSNTTVQETTVCEKKGKFINYNPTPLPPKK